MIWFLMLIRWTLPRFRYDQAMRLGWLGLFPLSILNIVLTGLVILAIGGRRRRCPRSLVPTVRHGPPALEPALVRQRFYLRGGAGRARLTAQPLLRQHVAAHAALARDEGRSRRR